MVNSIREKALIRAETGRQIAYAIQDAILAELPDDANLLTVLAHRIMQCNSEQNHWLANDLHNEHGEAFDGAGRFWNCGSKLCEYCLAKASRRNRKILQKIIETQRLLVGEHMYFMTLTMPNHGLDLLQARGIMNYAWTLFRKKQWFKKTFSGGCKSEEFTLTKRGYHYHQHFITRGRYVNYSTMRHHWTESLRVAFERNGLQLSCATSDQMAIANIRKVGSMKDAINEVAKYITKSSSWKKLKHSDLLDAARIERWPRMFEFFGSFRIPSFGVPVPEDENASNKTILDTEQLSDGDPERGWRARCRALGAERYLSELDQEIHDQSRFRMEQLKRHYGAAKFWRMRSKKIPNIAQPIEQIKAVDRRTLGVLRIPAEIIENGKGGFIDARTQRVVDYFDVFPNQVLADVRKRDKSRNVIGREGKRMSV